MSANSSTKVDHELVLKCTVDHRLFPNTPADVFCLLVQDELKELFFFLWGAEKVLQMWALRTHEHDHTQDHPCRRYMPRGWYRTVN